MTVLIKTSKVIYFVIAFISFMLLATAGTLYVNKISMALDAQTVMMSWCTFVIAVFLNLYFGYYASFLRGIGAIEKYNKINIGARVTQIIISITFLFMGGGIISVSVAYLIYALIIRMFSKRVFWNYRGMKEKVSQYGNTVIFEHVKEMFFVVWHNAWRDGLVTVSRYISNQAGTIIASMFLSLAETGVYSLIVQLITAILTIGGGIYSALQPEWQSAYIADDKETLRKDTGLVMTMYMYVSLIGVFVLVTMGPSLVQIFKPEMYLDRTMIFGIAFYLYMYNRTSYYASFISNMNMVPYAFSFIASGMIGVVLAYVLIRYTSLGIWAIVIGQVVPQMVYNYWKWPQIVLDYLALHISDVVKIGTREIMAKYNGILGKRI
jgi:O-antigen/teichoic acid export membrane protein